MRIFDAHHHIRMGDMMRNIISEIEGIYSYVTVMPNVPKLDTPGSIEYHQRNMEEAGAGSKGTVYLMTQYLSRGMTLSDKIVGVKVYPEGVTTGSTGSGIENIWDAEKEIAEIEERDLILMIHAEQPKVPDWVAEEEWLKRNGEWLLTRYPKLRIIIEHLSSEFAVNWMIEHRSERLAATVTLHHLFENWTSGLVCCPCIKRESDRRSLWQAVDYDWCFFGSDSAPHTLERKKAGAKGVYVPGNVAISLLTELPEDFHWHRGIKFYGLEDKGIDVFVKEQSWIVEDSNLSPFMANKQLDFMMR